MVEAKVLTKGQSLRLIKEAGTRRASKFEIPGYQILERLGKGSMGLVFKAKQTSVDRIVAVKVLLDSLALNKEFIKRFEREAKIAAKLSHNNIVNAIDAGEVEGHHYFVMEYVEGATIKDELDKNKVFDEKVAIKIVLAVAEAMKHAHERGLIHRDIKPENVMLTKDGNVKLADLGLARPTADENWAMSEAGMAIGTPYYISPEQVRGQVDVDIRGDIYSLGATLLPHGHRPGPVRGRDPAGGDAEARRQECHLEPPDHLNTRLSSGIGVVVETMMARESRQPLPEPRRPDPRPEMPAPGREPDDRRRQGRLARRPGRGGRLGRRDRAVRPSPRPSGSRWPATSTTATPSSPRWRHSSACRS